MRILPTQYFDVRKKNNISFEKNNLAVNTPITLKKEFNSEDFCKSMEFRTFILPAALSVVFVTIAKYILGKQNVNQFLREFNILEKIHSFKTNSMSEKDEYLKSYNLEMGVIDDIQQLRKKYKKEDFLKQDFDCKLQDVMTKYVQTKPERTKIFK